MHRIRITVVLAMMTMLTVAAAKAEPAALQWESIGADGVDATGLLWSEYHSQFIFVSTPDGYLVRHEPTGVWTDHREPGVAGREVTALTMVPRLSHRLLTGRLDADGYGSIEMSFPLMNDGDDAVVYAGPAGPIVTMTNSGIFNPMLYACARALGQTPGVVIASADSGMTWHEIEGHGHHDVTDIWVSIDIYVSGDAGVMYSPDGGTTWQPRNDGLPAGTVEHLWTFAPAVPEIEKGERDLVGHIYAAMADGVYHTATDVIQWQRVLDDPSPRQILIEPNKPYQPAHDVYVVTHDGRLLTAVRGEWVWTDLTGLLAGLDIIAVKSNYPKLTVATANAGVYRSGSLTDVPDAGVAPRLTVAPNPFNPTTTMSFTLPAPGHVQMAIHDARGREIRRLIDGPYAAGSHTAIWTGSDDGGRALPSGVYLCRLVTPWGVHTRKVSLVR